MAPVIDGEATGRARWLAERRTAITATDAGAILGVSKFATPIDVFLEKTNQGVGVVQTERMEAGNRMQRPIIDWWAERAGRLVEHALPFTFTRRPGSIMGASLDAVTFEGSPDGPRKPVDAKNIGWKKAEWGDAGSDKMPLTYAVQLAVQMHVIGADHAYLPVLFGGNELVCYEMERDLELETSIVERCTEFWEKYVATGTAPPVDGSASWGAYLTRAFAKHAEIILRATPELTETAAHYATTLERLTLVEMEAERLKNVLKLAIGENAAVEGPRWKASWKLSKDSTGTDMEATAKALALALAQVSGQPATKLFADEVAKNQIVTKKGSRRFLFTHKES